MKYEGRFLSEADGLPISVLAVIPDEKPYRAVVQLVHGMSEHKERYLPFMEFLKEKGYVTVIHDHRGHGKSVRSKRDLGYMYGGGAEAMLQDIKTVNDSIHKHFPKLPLILFGHSMGSLAVRAYTAKYDRSLDMLVICGSPSNNSMRPLGEAIAHLEKGILGARHKSRLLEKMSFGSYALRFHEDHNPNAWICSDQEVVRKYSESRECGFTFTDDAYLALFALMKQAYDVKNWHCTKPELPVLLISGAKDPCMGNVRKFAAAVRAMRSAGYRDVRGKLYPGMRHEILNEIGKEKVFHDICTYMKRKGF